MCLLIARVRECRARERREVARSHHRPARKEDGGKEEEGRRRGRGRAVHMYTKREECKDGKKRGEP